jgi:predicted nucleic acid-binding protein
MIAADTSSFSAYLKGEKGRDVDRVGEALAAADLLLPPVVVTELLSDPEAAKLIDAQIVNLATLELKDGFWVRAGHARRLLLTRNLKAKIAGALIAQACIDNDVALITRDSDFRHFAKYCGLKLA